MVNIEYIINTFDDGNQKYKNCPNRWIIIGDVYFQGNILQGKSAIQNVKDGTIINSISTWKLTKLTN